MSVNTHSLPASELFFLNQIKKKQRLKYGFKKEVKEGSSDTRHASKPGAQQSLDYGRPLLDQL
jgi:hypothetical protein